MNNKRFFWGTVAMWCLKRHYRNEVLPYAAQRGYTAEEVRKAAHRALDRLLDEI